MSEVSCYGPTCVISACMLVNRFILAIPAGIYKIRIFLFIFPIYPVTYTVAAIDYRTVFNFIIFKRFPFTVHITYVTAIVHCNIDTVCLIAANNIGSVRKIQRIRLFRRFRRR